MNQEGNLDGSEVVVLFPIRVHIILPITPVIDCAHYNHIVSFLNIPAKSMASIHQRGDGCPLPSLSNNETVGSAHGAVDVVGEVGGVVDRGEHTGLHLLLIHVCPGNFI